MKLRLPKSRLGWVFVGVYVLFVAIMIYKLSICDWNNPNTEGFDCLAIYGLAALPISLLVPFLFGSILHNIDVNFMILAILVNAALIISLLFWAGKGIEKLIQKRKSGTLKRKN